MKNLGNILLLNLCIFSLALRWTYAQSSQENPEVTKLETFFYNKCWDNTKSTDAFLKLRADTYEMYKYFEYAFKFLPDQRKTFCEKERPSLVGRMKEISNDLKPCLRGQEKFLAEFVKKSFEEFLHFFCHKDGEYTNRFFSREGTNCMNKITEANTNDLSNCVNNILGPDGQYVTKHQMCNELSMVNRCYSHLLNNYCQTSNDFKNLKDIFFEYVSAPCSSCIHSISTVVLIGSLLVHFILKKF